MSLIRYVTRIHFADRAMEDALPEELLARGLTAPLIVADADADEVLPRLLDCLPPRARPTVLRLDSAPLPRGARLPEAEGCDVVIGLGGAAAMHFTQFARPADPSRAPGHRHARSAPDVPRMAIPTLPGCLGLEPVGPQSAAGARGGPSAEDRLPVPAVLFCDPSLMQHAAPARLAVAGMDALVHCLETLLSTAWNPPADGMAIDGLRRAGCWLERLCTDPRDPDARREVMAAALNGALAGQKGLGAIHAMSHAAEALHIDAGGHGSLHAAFIGPALTFNAPAVPDRIERAAEALRLPSPTGLAAHLTGLGHRLGLPVALGALGVTVTGIARMAEIAAADVANRTNPRLAAPEDYRAMITAAL